MPRLLTKFFSLMALLVSGVSHAQFNIPPVSQQCLLAYQNYRNCQNEGSSAIGAEIEFCKNLNAQWISLGCAAQIQAHMLARNQCAQQMGIRPAELPPLQVCPFVPW